MADFPALVMQLETLLDGVVEHGSDDELFIASYLQGHVALVAKPMEVQDDANLNKLNLALTASLDAAFTNRELEQEDQQKVRALWQSLIVQLES